MEELFRKEAYHDKRQTKNMDHFKTWFKPLEIEASSFDEAIRKAREINKEYNTGQLKEIIT